MMYNKPEEPEFNVQYQEILKLLSDIDDDLVTALEYDQVYTRKGRLNVSALSRLLRCPVNEVIRRLSILRAAVQD